MASQWTLMDVLEKVEAAAGVGIQISKTPLDRIKSLFGMWTDEEMPKSPMVALNELAEMCGVQDRVGMVKQQAGLFLPSFLFGLCPYGESDSEELSPSMKINSAKSPGPWQRLQLHFWSSLGD